METRSKERLTGALILVAILVLLVPEMLSGRGSKPVTAEGEETTKPTVTYTLPSNTDPLAAAADQSALTARPTDETQPLLPAPETAPELPPVEEPVPPAPVVAAPVEPAPQPVPGVRPAKPKPEVAKPATPPVAAAAEASNVKAKADAKAKADLKAKADAKAKADPKAKADSGDWWVQVGSFSQRDNAQRLVGDLVAKGYSAQVRDAGKSQFKVRVGPVKNRKAAQALQAKLLGGGYRASVQAP